jgi:hypothetical protein
MEGKMEGKIGKSVVDPALFRLRAFEVDWVARLPSAPHGLAALLSAEADNWIVLGQRLGYFADNVDAQRRAGSLSKDVQSLLDGALDDSLERDAGDFARQLSAAQEDLTPERLRFLRVTLFADRSEWNFFVREAGEVARLLIDEPTRSIPQDTIDEVAWVLEGRESIIDGQPAWPAYWRSRAMPILSVTSPGRVARLREVDEILSLFDSASSLTAIDERVELVETGWVEAARPRRTSGVAVRRTLPRGGTTTSRRAPLAVGDLVKAVQNLARVLPVGHLEKRLSGLEKTVGRLEASLRGAAKRSSTAVRGSKRTTAKRTTAKRSTVKRAVGAKKGTVRKSAARNTTARKPAAAKKSAARKTTARKPAAARKTTARRPAAASKTTARKTTARKTTARKPAAARKTTARKTTARKPAARKTTARKPAAARKTTARKTTARKPAAARKTAARKPVTVRRAVRKPVAAPPAAAPAPTMPS